MHILYLHGFASSAHSSKARFLAGRLAPFRLTLHSPDFNEPDFETLTVTRMIGQVDATIAALPPGPVVLIGSSLGAFVAWHAAARSAAARDAEASGSGAARAGDGNGDRDTTRTHPVERLILLAPALDFGGNRMRDLGEDGLARWKATDRLEVFHYAYDEPRIVRYALHEDSLRYDSQRAQVAAPTLVIQGRRDSVVDPAMVERFASTHPNITLLMVDDEHQLAESLETIWRETARFLGLTGAA